MKRVLKKLSLLILSIMLIIGALPVSTTEAAFSASDCPYPINFVEVSTIYSTAYAIDSEGYVWGWGRALNYKVPTQLNTTTKFNKLSGNLMIDTDGNVWAGGTTKLTSGINYIKVSAGNWHDMIIDEDGNLFGRGSNTFGGLGDGTFVDQTNFIQIKPGTKFKDVAAGHHYTIAIDTSGNLWTWGYNGDGELGNGYVGQDEGGHLVNPTPTIIKSGTKFTKVAALGSTPMAIDTSGNLWSWGYNESGAVGNGGVSNATSTSSGSKIQTIPVQIKSGTKFKDIEAGEYHNMAIDEDGYLYTWGSNGNGELGSGLSTSIDATVPGKVKSNTKFTKMAASNANSYAIDENGILWAWGNNFYGSIGNGYSSSATSPVTEPLQITRSASYTVTFMDGTTVAKTETVAAGGSATAPTISKAGYTLSWDTDFSNVTSNLTVNAVWTANTNTGYKIQHYKQNTSLSGYTLEETETKTGTTNALAVALAKTYTGFTENTTYYGRVETGTIKADGSLVLKLYYDRNTYNVTLNVNGGTINSGNVTQYTYGVQKTLPTNVAKDGYTFGGWYESNSFTGDRITVISSTSTGNKQYYAKWTTKTYSVTFKEDGRTIETQYIEYGKGATAPTLSKPGYTLTWDKDFSNVTSNLTVNAVWTANTNTTYRIEHYKQKSTIIDYELVETEQKTGTTGEQVTATAKTYEGFIENTNHSERVTTGIIQADGSLVLKLYYDKITYSVTFKSDGQTIDTQFVDYGSSATAPTISKPGYTLSWDKDFSNVTSNLTVNAVWTANTNTKYKVEHYLRTTDMEVESYSLYETENKTGTTGEEVRAASKTYNGFTENTTHPQRVQSGTIQGDGSLVLKLYYDRNTYNITYVLNGGSATSILTSTYLYGKELILSSRVEKTGYVFAGWYNNQNLSGNKVISIVATETGDKTFYAKWIEADNSYLTSDKYEIEEDYISKVSPNTSVDAFLNNINTNGTVKVLNSNNEEISGTTLIGTGNILQIEKDGEKYEYEIVVRGDIDGNGKITVTDLSMLNQQIVRRITLTGAKEKAADIEYSGRITVTDLSMMNQALVGRITL